MNFIQELRWRVMIHDITPGVEELLEKEMVTGYLGIDPTAESLHIGHLVSIMLLKHFQNAGHSPIALIGGATGMIGDPSGKAEERQLLSEEIIRYNQDCIKKQLSKFLDFDCGTNSAEIVNNYDWIKEYNFIDFIRDVGKHITVNYMLAKESVKSRLESGISFTEFSYQLVQAYDFYYLFRERGCKLQMGGSDQWGNITTGIELIRRKTGQEAFGLTCPLLIKAEGGKFGKTEQGNIWLSPQLTSPYKFYQFWLNISDEDAEKYIKIFSFFPKEEINDLINEHKNAPHLRLLQKTLAKDLTIRVHSQQDYKISEQASQILFGEGTIPLAELIEMPENILLTIFEGVEQREISRSDINIPTKARSATMKGINIIDFLTEKTSIFLSKSEARRLLKSNSISINKTKVDENKIISESDLIKGKYILVQKGKKNYILVKVKE